MKLATFTVGLALEIGVVEGDRVISLSRPAPALARDMIDLIARWPQIEGEVRRIAKTGAHALKLSDVVLKAPIARPGKILAIGLNYADHIAESGQETPKEQVWFCKQSTSVNGPFDPILLPKADRSIDYEVELVAVIGAGGKHIAKADAAKAVFGYCVGNDVSARRWQMMTPQWTLGKGFDTHAPFGPWITTADEVDPHALNLRTFVNGEKRQDSNTKNLVFDIWDQIAHVSQAMTLEAGDLIFTGTPGGVGMAFRPPIFLRADDVVRLEIDGLGAIEAKCVAEA